MQAVTLLALAVKFDRGRVFIDGQPVKCTEYKIDIPTGGGPVTVWCQEAPETDGTFRAVLCSPLNIPLVFSLVGSAVTMLSRQSATTVVIWMCRAASIEL